MDDLLDSMITMMNQEAYIGPINTGIIFVSIHLSYAYSACKGNPNEFTIKQLAELVIKLSGSKSKIIQMPLPADDPKQRRPDITLAKYRIDVY